MADWRLGTGGEGWMGVYGGSEAHWARHEKNHSAYGFRWITLCGRLVRASHFHQYGSGFNPQSGPSQYDGRPKCSECDAARRPSDERVPESEER